MKNTPTVIRRYGRHIVCLCWGSSGGARLRELEDIFLRPKLCLLWTSSEGFAQGRCADSHLLHIARGAVMAKTETAGFAVAGPELFVHPNKSNQIYSISEKISYTCEWERMVWRRDGSPPGGWLRTSMA